VITLQKSSRPTTLQKSSRPHNLTEKSLQGYQAYGKKSSMLTTLKKKVFTAENPAEKKSSRPTNIQKSL
jgi:hypothetical protein